MASDRSMMTLQPVRVEFKLNGRSAGKVGFFGVEVGGASVAWESKGQSSILG